jgi:hypothetical protein
LSGTAADPESVPPDVAGEVFAAVEAQRSASDQMMWQVPALSLTAQSFLLTISIGNGASTGGRVLAAALGLIAALATIQLMLKHRLHEEELSRWLERFATEQRWTVVPHRPAGRRAYAYHGAKHDWETAAGPLARLRWKIADHRSIYVWIWTLAAFALVDLAAFVLALTGTL